MAMNEIDYFIKSYAKLYAQNPKLQISHHTIYYELMKYDIPSDEFNVCIDDQIEGLQNIFKNAKNLNVYIHDTQKTFLQFSNHKKDDHKSIKIYLNIPKEYVGYVSDEIFKFIDSKNYETMSTVSRFVRADGIVLRMFEIKDAEEVLDFVNNQLDINNIARNRNPFLLKDGIASIAYDDMISYNSTVSDCLCDYFKSLREKNDFKSASLDNFISYMQRYYYNTFNDGSNLLNYLNKETVKENLDRFNDFGSAIANHEQVIRLFILLLNGEVDKKYFYSFFNKCKEDSKDKSLINFFNDKMNEKINSSQDSNNEFVSTKNIIDSYILYANNKYRNSGDVAEYLNIFIKENDFNSITRDNDYRKMFSKMNKNLIRLIIGNDIYGYVNNIVNNNIKDKEFVEEDNFTQKYNLLYDASVSTARKYGYSQLEGALKHACEGDYKFFTNEEYRKKLKETFNPGDVDKICISYVSSLGYNKIPDDYIKIYAQDICKKILQEQSVYS